MAPLQIRPVATSSQYSRLSPSHVICVLVTEQVQGAKVGLRVGVIVDGSTSSGEAVAVGRL